MQSRGPLRRLRTKTLTSHFANIHVLLLSPDPPFRIHASEAAPAKSRRTFYSPPTPSPLPRPAAMATVMQKIKDIEDEMSKTQKNKATAHHLGLLKAKLAKLRRELLTPTTKGGGGAGEGFDVTKSGDARVGLVGFPSVGKSTLLNKLTGTFSEVASYEFTTLTCIPGVIMYKGAKVQLLDLPGIIEGAKDGKGRGRQVISTARTCNVILIVLDAIKPITHKRLIEKELEGFGIRLNKTPPNMTFRRKEKGGINFTSTVANTHLDLDTVKAICSEYRIHNADVSLRFDATADDLIDVIEGSRIYMPCIYVVNKIDQITVEELDILDKLPHYCPIRRVFTCLLDMCGFSCIFPWPLKHFLLSVTC
ncbi:hypothetical protein VPH35_035745 [Triticum aestivum]